MALVIDIHALQSLPPSNINRDDTGAPKSAVFGGVPRQRVSSQSWKRAMRKEFEHSMPAGTVGFRTKFAADLVVKKIVEISGEAGEVWDEERASAATKGLFEAAKIALKEPKEDERSHGPETGYLLFLSPRQIENAARNLVETDGAKPKAADAKAWLDTAHSIDIAMFGRMVADAPAYNVDAAVQVAHAIGIHESEPEFDYYTAVDDIVEDNAQSGAGMIGTMQMMSSTLYRFATVDMDSLAENLGDADAATEAAVAFVNAFVTSLPTGKQNSYAHNTLPELVYVVIRDSRSISLANAFEDAVRTGDGSSRRVEGARRLAYEAEQIESRYGFVPRSAFAVGMEEMTEPLSSIAVVTTFPNLRDELRAALRAEGRA